MTGYGVPIDNIAASLTVGYHGPVLMQDVVFLDTMAHFDRERIPERVVHAKGAGKCRVRGVSMLDGGEVIAEIIIMVLEPKTSTPLTLKSATGDETEPVSSTFRPHKLRSTLLLYSYVLVSRRIISVGLFRFSSIFLVSPYRVTCSAHPNLFDLVP